MPTITTSTMTAVTLKPSLQTRVRRQLKAYAALTTQIRALKVQAADALTDIEAAFETSGQGEALDNGCSVDDFKLKLVRGITKTLDRKFMMMEYGVTQEMFDEATTSRPKMAYLKVTAPGLKEEGDA